MLRSDSGGREIVKVLENSARSENRVGMLEARTGGGSKVSRGCFPIVS